MQVSAQINKDYIIQEAKKIDLTFFASFCQNFLRKTGNIVCNGW